MGLKTKVDLRNQMASGSQSGKNDSKDLFFFMFKEFMIYPAESDSIDMIST